ncbi:hypothetical protein [Dubosiella newyorkensis]|uniref:Uncharacterized protein n=1 Tax=Dubosiella newyorkensis TaxID=1862672 RepID=A0A1U7NN14_9FIRM|nr:hypothetical protein [Dubosiella newyorkensis]OLU46681.1 hypothetical protein BO225_05815 [Dubosiella newyorkensis]
MLKLNEISKRITGLSVEEINSLPIEEKMNQKEGKNDRRDPFLALNRITTIQEVDQRLSQLIGNSYAKK